MNISTILLCSALSAGAIASLNATEIVQKTPHCALKCSIQLLSAANYSLLDSAPCLCTNITLQAQLSICVQQICTRFSDQVAAANVQTEIYEGYPQESRSQYVQTISITFFCLVLPFLILQTSSRFLVSRQIWPDDWAAMAATVFIVGAAALEITAAQKGFGCHYWNVDPNNAVFLLKSFYTLQVFYIIIQVLTKVSLLLPYSRVFSSP